MIKTVTMLGLLLAPTLTCAAPMEIESSKMTFLHKIERAEFVEKVHVKRDDFELYCDRLLAYYKNNKLDRAEAFGHIKLIQKDVTGTSDKAILDQKNNKITLIGNAVLEQAGGRVEGETIVHDMNLEKTVVHPAKGGRTHMTIESDEMNNQAAPRKGESDE